MTWNDYDPAALVLELETRRDYLRLEIEAAVSERGRASGSRKDDFLMVEAVAGRFLDVIERLHGRALTELHNGRQGRIRGVSAFSSLRSMELTRLIALGRH